MAWNKAALVLLSLILCSEGQVHRYGLSSYHYNRRPAQTPCPYQCICAPMGSDPPRSKNLNVMLTMHRYQRLIYGYGGMKFQENSPENNGREMTCLGLSSVPSYIPGDIKKLSLYGDDSDGEPPQKDQSSRSSDMYYDGTLSDSPLYRDRYQSSYSSTPFSQLTTVPKRPFLLSRELKQLAIEGNRIKIVHERQFEMLHDLKKLSLKNNRLKTISREAFDGLTALEDLDLSGNHIEELHKSILQKTTKLKRLNLKSNRLYYLDEYALRTLTQLEFLDMSNNYINDLPAAIFSELVNLKELYLDNNNIAILGWIWFRQLARLEKLSLKGNGVVVVPPQAFEPLYNLRVLSLANNKLDTLTYDTFKNLAKMETLDLSNNSISKIDDSTFHHMSKLESLNLNRNRIQSIGRLFQSNFSSLHVLSLSRNRIETLQSQDIRRVMKLNKLDLSYNKLKDIRTRTFTGFTNLRILKLDHNDIRDIEDEAFTVAVVNTLSKLTWLYLQYNEMTAIRPRALYGLPYLKFLNLAHNKIENMASTSFNWMGGVRSLMLNTNKLSKIDTGMFQKMGVLKHLNLADNKLRTLPFNTLLGLENLEEINLGSNRIKGLADDAFLDTPNLRRIDLRSNRINTVDMKTFSPILRLRYLNFAKNKISRVRMSNTHQKSIKYLSFADNNLATLSEKVPMMMRPYGYIHLYGNPWACDCRLAWLANRENRLRVVNSHDVMCKTPSWYTGRSVLEIQPDRFVCVPQSRAAAAMQMGRRHVGGLSCALPPADIENIAATQIAWKRKAVFPMHATVLNTEGLPACAGLHVDRDWVLTMGSCLSLKREDGSPLVNRTAAVRLGEYREGRTRDAPKTIESIFVHPQSNNGRFDVALAKLKPTYQSGARAQEYPCVLTEHHIDVVQRLGMKGVVSAQQSRGTTSTRVKLRMAPIYLTPKPQCRASGFICGTSKIYRIKPDQEVPYRTKGSPLFFDMGPRGWTIGGIQNGQLNGNEGWFMPAYAYLSWMENTIQRYSRQ
ncbi:toll-like receptor Tollo [Lingula anatina]|uniref:Toll-like receptor Tollo n=1 Tax=Lingula anatina TaxID=7574 RepID=A0A1S3IYX6_LINAN|nr:toll-like receptor Tollo [Lingula anatina]XP_013403220.1 toll-like receptor Tollo [Lingula anatina]XP_013403221.1 toll-like receptor Tollo [Lingula anatina]|eukprot:XP_013403218.1 toll-like receptor Tollo [Lingula anatina]